MPDAAEHIPLQQPGSSQGNREESRGQLGGASADERQIVGRWHLVMIGSHDRRTISLHEGGYLENAELDENAKPGYRYLPALQCTLRLALDDPSKAKSITEGWSLGEHLGLDASADRTRQSPSRAIQADALSKCCGGGIRE